MGFDDITVLAYFPRRGSGAIFNQALIAGHVEMAMDHGKVKLSFHPVAAEQVLEALFNGSSSIKCFEFAGGNVKVGHGRINFGAIGSNGKHIGF